MNPGPFLLSHPCPSHETLLCQIKCESSPVQLRLLDSCHNIANICSESSLASSRDTGFSLFFFFFPSLFPSPRPRSLPTLILAFLQPQMGRGQGAFATSGDRAEVRGQAASPALHNLTLQKHDSGDGGGSGACVPACACVCARLCVCVRLCVCFVYLLVQSEPLNK